MLHPSVVKREKSLRGRKGDIFHEVESQYESGAHGPWLMAHGSWLMAQTKRKNMNEDKWIGYMGHIKIREGKKRDVKEWERARGMDERAHPPKNA